MTIAEEETHLVPGYRLDRYELLCPIGVGGMASVWVARLLGKHGFEKLVAIKTILPRYARDPNFQEMFLDEARIASRIQHVNVAQILDLGDQHGVLYLAMEWVDGDALSKLAHAVETHGAAFPPGVAMRIMADVCAGLHAAHELRDRSGAHLEIVHRDISPHNILVGAQGVAKVIDFGIAKARDRAAGDTRTGSFKGKVKYIAPEQALSPKTTDRRADLWAVGAVLYTLLANRSPYESDNDMATLMQLAQQKPLEPLPAEVPESLQKIVSRALAWNPDNRYATAAELGQALEEAMSAAGMATTSADVAAFCAAHLAGRVRERERAVAIAMSAAAERSGVARLVEPAGRPSSNERPAEGLSASPETSPTLGVALTMTFNSPGAARRRGFAAAAGVVALIAVAADALVHPGRDPRGASGGTSVASVPVLEAPSGPSAAPIAAIVHAPSSSIAPPAPAAAISVRPPPSPAPAPVAGR